MKNNKIPRKVMRDLQWIFRLGRWNWRTPGTSDPEIYRIRLRQRAYEARGSDLVAGSVFVFSLLSMNYIRIPDHWPEWIYLLIPATGLIMSCLTFIWMNKRFLKRNERALALFYSYTPCCDDSHMNYVMTAESIKNDHKNHVLILSIWAREEMSIIRQFLNSSTVNVIPTNQMRTHEMIEIIQERARSLDEDRNRR